MLAYKTNDTWTRWSGQPRPFNGEGSYNLSPNAEAHYRDDELETFGLYRVQPASPPPEGKRVVSTRLTDENGRPVEAVETEDIPGPTAGDVNDERDSRFERLSFDFDFGDARGIHTIRMTRGDMVGWNDVDTWADTKLKLGKADATLPILTETGPVIITPMEWYAIQERGAEARQTIWQASFALAAMNPIPADYATNEAYWP